MNPRELTKSIYITSGMMVAMVSNIFSIILWPIIIAVSTGCVYTTCRYSYDYWSQYYRKNIGHHCHHHARGDINAFGQLSWVHFLRPTKDKPFVFLDRTGNTYTPKQDKGDLIIFPSYVWHEVLPNETNAKRFVVAGNLWITELDTLWKQKI